MAELAKHRIEAGRGDPSDVQALIELELGVRTRAVEHSYGWWVFFDAPRDVSLDFLVPDVLPPGWVSG